MVTDPEQSPITDEEFAQLRAALVEERRLRRRGRWNHNELDPAQQRLVGAFSLGLLPLTPEQNAQADELLTGLYAFDGIEDLEALLDGRVPRSEQ
jgi:hypothetical protein